LADYFTLTNKHNHLPILLDATEIIIVFDERGGAVVEALRYKPEGSGFDSRWRDWNISLT
jgi:hypothetical protein